MPKDSEAIIEVNRSQGSRQNFVYPFDKRWEVASARQRVSKLGIPTLDVSDYAQVELAVFWFMVAYTRLIRS